VICGHCCLRERSESVSQEWRDQRDSKHRYKYSHFVLFFVMPFLLRNLSCKAILTVPLLELVIHPFCTFLFLSSSQLSILPDLRRGSLFGRRGLLLFFIGIGCFVYGAPTISAFAPVSTPVLKSRRAYTTAVVVPLHMALPTRGRSAYTLTLWPILQKIKIRPQKAKRD